MWFLGEFLSLCCDVSAINVLDMNGSEWAFIDVIVIILIVIIFVVIVIVIVKSCCIGSK